MAERKALAALTEAARVLDALRDVAQLITEGRLTADETIRAAMRGQLASLVRRLEHVREQLGDGAPADRGDQLVIAFARAAMEVQS